MSNQEWTLEPQTGIKSSEISILFGMRQSELRSLLSGSFSGPKSHFPDEDEFVSNDGSTELLIRYENTLVRDIEFQLGSLKYDGLELIDGTTFSAVAKALEEKGCTFRPSRWMGDGQDCIKLGINIATQEELGGDTEEVEWVVTSSNFH